MRPPTGELEIDWSHWSTKGLVFAAPFFNENDATEYVNGLDRQSLLLTGVDDSNWVTSESGEFNSHSLQLNGTDESIRYSSLGFYPLDQSGVGELTWMAWVRPDAGASIDTILCATTLAGGLNDHGLIVIDFPSEQVRWLMNGNNQVLRNPGVENSVWQHLTITHKGTDSALYSIGNGRVWTATNASGDSIVSGSDRLYVGQRRDGLEYDGRIMDVRVYNRSLGTDEVRAIASQERFAAWREKLNNLITLGAVIDRPFFPYIARGYDAPPAHGQSVHIDWSNPLTHRLMSCSAFAQGVGPAFNSVSNRFSTGDTNFAWDDTENGQVNYDGTGVAPHYELNDPSLVDIRPPYSMALLISAPDGDYGISNIQTGDFSDEISNFSGAVIALITTGANEDVEAHIGDNTGATSADIRSINWANVMNLDIPAMYSYTCFKAGAGQVMVADLYVDGVKAAAGTTSGSGGNIGYPSNKFGRIGSTNGDALGNYYFYAIWARPLSPQEHADLANNPWQIFLGDPERQIEIGPASLPLPLLDPSALPAWFKPT